jgi:Holliday junction resolvase RusA-like endonuclease
MEQKRANEDEEEGEQKTFLKCPFLPPSVNKCYMRFRRSVHLTSEAKKFKDNVAALCVGKKKVLGTVALYIRAHKQTARRWDVDNILKMIIDGIQHRLIGDDSLVMRIVVEKIISLKTEPEGFELIVKQLTPPLPPQQPHKIKRNTKLKKNK